MLTELEFGAAAPEVRVTTAYINRIATAVPTHDVHDAFLSFARSLLEGDRRGLLLFRRMAERSGIEHRYSSLAPASDPTGDAIDAEAFYTRGNFPDVAARMRAFEARAPALAAAALARLELGSERNRITHLLITCCTGFSAPGLDRARGALRATELGRAHHDWIHGLLRRDQRAEARTPHRAI